MNNSKSYFLKQEISVVIQEIEVKDTNYADEFSSKTFKLGKTSLKKINNSKSYPDEFSSKTLKLQKLH